MKKTLLVLAIVFASSAAFAQTFMAGPRVGINSSQLTVGDAVGASTGDRYIGWQAGIFTRLSFGNFFIQPELLYSKTGGQSIQNLNFVFPDIVGIASFDYTFGKLDMPILVGYTDGFMRFNAGPVFGLLVDGKLNKSSDLTWLYNDFTFGLQAGIGVDVWKLIIDLKYEVGISQFSKNFRVGGEPIYTDERQNQFVLSVGYVLFEK